MTKSVSLYRDELARRENGRTGRIALWVSLASLAVAAISLVVSALSR